MDKLEQFKAELVRAAPLVKALKDKGVKTWPALRIAAACMPAIDDLKSTFATIRLVIGDHFTDAEIAALLADHFGMEFLGDKSHTTPLPAMDSELVAKLARTVKELELSVRAENAMTNAGFAHVVDFVMLPEMEMLGLKPHGQRLISRTTIKEIKDVLADMGLSLGMHLDDATIAAARAEIERRNAATASKP